MQAFKATYTKNGSGPEVKMVGAGSFAAAAKKAEDWAAEHPDHDLVSLETSDETIL